MQVYVIGIKDRGPCKIGISRDARSRLLELQVGNHEELFLWSFYRVRPEFARNIEMAVHRHFGSRSLRGEWFSISSKDASDFIESLDLSDEKWAIYVPLSPEGMFDKSTFQRRYMRDRREADRQGFGGCPSSNPNYLTVKQFRDGYKNGRV